MLAVKFSCSDSLSECGSIDSASPWLANLNVLAAATPPNAVTSASDSAKLSRAIGATSIFFIMRCFLRSGAGDHAAPAR